jgi:hypothetical protein
MIQHISPNNCGDWDRDKQESSAEPELSLAEKPTKQAETG